MGWDLQVRENQDTMIDPDLLQSGDFLGIMTTDGLGGIIMYGTGSHLNHCTMALRFDGELYIIESTSGGIQRTLWADWIAE